MRDGTFLWHRRRWGVREYALLLAILVVLDYDVGSALTDGLLQRIQLYGGGW